jgi:ribosome-binding protein aMBF1 (putative translation factor)
LQAFFDAKLSRCYNAPQQIRLRTRVHRRRITTLQPQRRATGCFPESLMFPATQPEFGQALTAWRRRQGWTQEELAKRANVPLRTLQNWEAGRTTPRPSSGRKLEALQSGLEQQDRFSRIEARLEKIETLLERILET